MSSMWSLGKITTRIYGNNSDHNWSISVVSFIVSPHGSLINCEVLRANGGMILSFTVNRRILL